MDTVCLGTGIQKYGSDAKFDFRSVPAQYKTSPEKKFSTKISRSGTYVCPLIGTFKSTIFNQSGSC